MAKLLRIDSSIHPDASVSQKLTGEFTRAWAEAGGEVVSRDLNAEQIPHLPYFGLHFPTRDGVPENEVGLAARALQDEIIEQVLEADALVIGAPLYNYSVPSTLKAWMDYLHVPGRTAMNPDGTGALVGKPAVVMSSRGAAYDTAEEVAALDHAVPALQALLGTAMGMNVEAITVDRTLAHLLPELQPQVAESMLTEAVDKAMTRGRELALSL